MRRKIGVDKILGGIMHKVFNIYHFLAVNWIAITALCLTVLKWVHTVATRIFEAQSAADDQKLTGSKRFWYIVAYVAGKPEAK